MPRWASRSSTSRKLRGNRKYSQTAYWMTSAGKRGGDMRDGASAIHSRPNAES